MSRHTASNFIAPQAVDKLSGVSNKNADLRLNAAKKYNSELQLYLLEIFFINSRLTMTSTRNYEPVDDIVQRALSKQVPQSK